MVWSPNSNNQAGSGSLEGLCHRGVSKPFPKGKQEVNPVWIIRKPPVSSEPKYRIPKLRNMDAPWRRPVVELSTREVDQHEDDPIQELETDVFKKECNLAKHEKFSDSQLSVDPELVTSVEPEKVKQEPSKLLSCGDQEQDEARLPQPTKCSEAVDRGPEGQHEENRDVSQIFAKESSDVQGKSLSKSDNVLKTGNISGKKKKSKKCLDAKKS